MSQIPDPTSGSTPGTPPPEPTGPAASPPPPSAAPLDYGANSSIYTGPEPTADDRNMAMLCYILGIFGFLGWVGPLIIWLTKKDTSAFVNDQGKEVLNWELTIIIGYVGCMFTFCIPFVNFLGFLCIVALGITNLVLCIMGAMKVNKGQPNRMPFSIKFIK